jgi:hypothetical protein
LVSVVPKTGPKIPIHAEFDENARIEASISGADGSGLIQVGASQGIEYRPLVRHLVRNDAFVPVSAAIP